MAPAGASRPPAGGITRVIAALDRLSQATAFAGDDDLVFGNVHTGSPPARSTVNNRFKERLAQAGARHVRFHDLRHTYGT